VEIIGHCGGDEKTEIKKFFVQLIDEINKNRGPTNVTVPQ